MTVFNDESHAGRIAQYLKEAREMRQIAALMSLRDDRAKLMRAAMEYEKKAAAVTANWLSTGASRAS